MPRTHPARDAVVDHSTFLGPSRMAPARARPGRRWGAAVALATLASVTWVAPAVSGAATGPAAAVDAGQPVQLLARDFTGCDTTKQNCRAVTRESVGDDLAHVSDRDVGISVKVDDGGAPPALGNTGLGGGRQQTWLWLFGDTSVWRRGADGTYRTLFGGNYRTSTAGLTRYDPAGRGSTLQQLASTSFTLRSDMTDPTNFGMDFFVFPDLTRLAPTDGTDDPDKCPAGASPAAWPQSAVLLPGETQVPPNDSATAARVAVLVFFQTICLVDAKPVRYLDTGVALWSWSDDPSEDPSQAYSPPLAGSLGVRAHAPGWQTLNPRLFRNHDGQGNERDFGYEFGATVERGAYGTYLKVFRCHDRNQVGRSGCYVAQAPLSGNWTVDGPHVADPTRWSYQRASDWVPFTLAPGTTATGARPTDAYEVTRGVAPANGFASVAYDPGLGRYVMTSLAAGAPPGSMGTQVVVRTAPFVNGPWDNGVVLDLPARQCATGLGCYSPVLHPELDDPATGDLGLTYVQAQGQELPDPNHPGQVSERQQMRVARLPRAALAR